MTINDRKIISAIEQNLSNGKFVIFPYGKWGKRVKYLLNKKYRINEIAVVDNELSHECNDILGIHDIESIASEDYVVLFAVTSPDVYSDLLEQTQLFHGKQVCDIAALECKNYFFSMCSEKMYIEECNSVQLATIFDMTRQTWSQLGREQPYWSVIGDKKYLLENMDEERMEEFYNSGHGNCKAIIQTLIRNEVIRDQSESRQLDITEIGCGTGRVTKYLSHTFNKVTAIDVSAENMSVAASVVQERNVSFCLYKKIEDYQALPKTDVIYSIIVLQHNVPPVIEYILNAMLKSLKAGGVAIFQIPTYREAYEFRYDEYIDASCIGEMEMHLLPQKKIFEIAYANNCIPMEVYQDGLSGQDDFSCTFVMRKIGAAHGLD